LLAKPPPRNVNHGNDRFAMFNKDRDIPDNVFVERLWRSVKYEEVYLRA
jgi:hypothetical protein